MSPATAQRYGIKGTPTLILSAGKEAELVVGADASSKSTSAPESEVVRGEWGWGRRTSPSARKIVRNKTAHGEETA